MKDNYTTDTFNYTKASNCYVKKLCSISIKPHGSPMGTKKCIVNNKMYFADGTKIKYIDNNVITKKQFATVGEMTDFMLNRGNV